MNGHVYRLWSQARRSGARTHNTFYLPAEFYSQGNANYSDVNQNRRSDVLLNPAVGDSEVLAFLGLIQADGYNPLTVYGSRFTIPPIPARRLSFIWSTGRRNCARFWPNLSRPAASF